MKPEDIKNALDAMVPSEAQKERMLSNITEPGAAKAAAQTRFPVRRAAFIASALAVVVLAGVGSRWLFAGGISPPRTDSSTASLTGNAYDAKAGGESERTDFNLGKASSGGERETTDACLARYYYFKLSGRVYTPLYQSMADDFGFKVSPADSSGLKLSPAPADVGEKLADITGNADPSLVGGAVYRYRPAGSEAVVAVKVGGDYTLYRFTNFEKYEKNGDEDAAEYLRVYGINAASDIAKIQLIRHSEAAKLENRTDVAAAIADAAGIAKFYGYYSVLKDSSAAYFDKLFSYRDGVTSRGMTSYGSVTSYGSITSRGRVTGSGGGETAVEPVPPDYGEIMPYAYAQNTPAAAQDTPATASYAVSAPLPSAAGGTAQGSAGSAGNALADSVTIRIFNRSGLYYSAEYYPHMGFISRHQIGAELTAFLTGYLG